MGRQREESEDGILDAAAEHIAWFQSACCRILNINKTIRNDCSQGLCPCCDNQKNLTPIYVSGFPVPFDVPTNAENFLRVPRFFELGSNRLSDSFKKIYLAFPWSIIDNDA
jgi:hypothetical protein